MTLALRIAFALAVAGTLAARGGEPPRTFGISPRDGRSLRGAVRSLAPCADPAKRWPKQEVESADRARILPLLVKSLRHDDDPSFRATLAKFAGNPVSGEHWRLWSTVPP